MSSLEFGLPTVHCALMASWRSREILEAPTSPCYDKQVMFTTIRHGDPRVCQSNETHSKMTSGNHNVFNAGKPLPKLDNVDAPKSAPTEAGHSFGHFLLDPYYR